MLADRQTVTHTAVMRLCCSQVYVGTSHLYSCHRSQQARPPAWTHTNTHTDTYTYGILYSHTRTCKHGHTQIDTFPPSHVHAHTSTLTPKTFVTHSHTHWDTLIAPRCAVTPKHKGCTYRHVQYTHRAQRHVLVLLAITHKAPALRTQTQRDTVRPNRLCYPCIHSHQDTFSLVHKHPHTLTYTHKCTGNVSRHSPLRAKGHSYIHTHKHTKETSCPKLAESINIITQSLSALKQFWCTLVYSGTQCFEEHYFLNKAPYYGCLCLYLKLRNSK